MLELELCCCGHANDHVARACGHDAVAGDGRCACKFGQRVDVATFRLSVEQNELLSQVGMTLMRLLAVMETAVGVQSKIVPNSGDSGRFHVEIVQRKPDSPLVLVPR